MIKGIQNLISGIKTIIEGIKIGITFLGNLLKSLVELIRLLFTTLGNATTLIATLPSWLIAFATATIAVAVLYIILGRETGKK